MKKGKTLEYSADPIPAQRLAPEKPWVEQGLNKIYWFWPLLLTAVQCVVTIASMTKIRYEELAESIRNVFWLHHRLIYDNVSSNVGWYGTLLATYDVFGFSLFTAKFVRVVLHLIGLYCVAAILRRRMDVKGSTVLLVVIGMSPIVLFFNTLQTSFGTDFCYSAICLWLLLSIRFQSILDLGKTFLLGFLAMVAALTYPTFLLYIPSLIIIAIWSLRKAVPPLRSAQRKVIYILTALAGFCLPVAIAFLYLKPPQALIGPGGGLFRGGGRIGLDWVLFKESLATVLHDFFVGGSSYYFDVTHPDFSGMLGIASFICIGGTSIYLFIRQKADRTFLLAAILLLGLNFIVPNLSVVGLPGMRRCTGVLTASFVLFALVWKFYACDCSQKIWLSRIGVVFCLLLPLSNILKFPSILADVTKFPDYEMEPAIVGKRADSEIVFSQTAALTWFLAKEKPSEALDYYLSGTEQGRVLCCFDEKGEPSAGRYQEMYAALEGYRLWNGLAPVEIHAWDWKKSSNITLRTTLWTENYFHR